MSADRTVIPLFCNSRKVREWTTDPGHLHFSDYRDRAMSGPPDEKGSRECINLQLMRQPFSYMIAQQANEYRNGEDPHYGDWNRALECGAVTKAQRLRGLLSAPMTLICIAEDSYQ